MASSRSARTVQPRRSTRPARPVAAQPADDLPALGRRLRYFRRTKKLTLHELAGGAACSASLLSRIENDRVTPSLTTLHRLCRALDISVAALLTEAEEQPCVVYGPTERPSHVRSDIVEGDGSTAESLVPFANVRLLEGFVISLAANRKMCGPFEHDGEEVGYVLEGELKLIVGGKTYTIAEGGSFFFRSDLPHLYGANGRRGCRVLWINTPPTF
jgi:transcriptional regulator with XRE-family HTH domain